MENNTTIKIPKKYQDKIQSIDKDSDGYWAYSEYGYYFAEMDTACHTAHEDSQKDLLRVIRSLRKCNCEECQKELKEMNKDAGGN